MSLNTNVFIMSKEKKRLLRNCLYANNNNLRKIITVIIVVLFISILAINYYDTQCQIMEQVKHFLNAEYKPITDHSNYDSGSDINNNNEHLNKENNNINDEHNSIIDDNSKNNIVNSESNESNNNLNIINDDKNIINHDDLLTSELTQRFRQRRKHIQKTCHEFGLDDPTPNDRLHRFNNWEFLINENYGLVYCNIFKAASSSWLFNFNILGGHSAQYLNNTRMTPVAISRQIYQRPSVTKLEEALDKYLSFLIVRHPFERLISAYADKFVKNANTKYVKQLGREIIETRRRWNRAYKENSSHVSEKYKDRVKQLGNFGNIPPTFEELIRSIICKAKREHPLNEHWAVMTSFCSPCFANFDIIIKFEHLQEEQNYLIQLAKLNNIIKPIWINPSHKHKDAIKEYFSQLSIEQITELVEIYKYDFLLFDYSPIDYFKYGQVNVTTLPCESPSLFKYF